MNDWSTIKNMEDEIRETLLHVLACFSAVQKILDFGSEPGAYCQCWLSSPYPDLTGRYGRTYGPNTGRDFPGSKLLLHFFRELWSIGNKQLCRMVRQWVIPTSNRTSLAPKRHPKCIKCFTASIVGFGFKHSPSRTIEQRGLKSYIEPSVVIPRVVGHPTPTPKRHYNIGIQ